VPPVPSPTNIPRALVEASSTSPLAESASSEPVAVIARSPETMSIPGERQAPLTVASPPAVTSRSKAAEIAWPVRLPVAAA